ncbi:hypothetical protein MACH07_22940 [Flagellimonas marinaquae]|uniref:RHS repeat-associated core domain-containing protein n=1 Tax=Flagellimonas marinaquae TaxID=254955 RepID=A0AA48HFG7_9FLAO|nr:hypothetical protein MACH07_22940 [Allomuricauda aquimarina]
MKEDNHANLGGYTDYYPFGMPMPNRNLEDANNYRYGYQGQFAEEDKETGLNAFELRMYDSRIGRWTSPDPYGQFHSPYIGMGNNPISYADPDGGCVGSDCPDKVTYGQNDCQCSTFDMETGIATTHFSNTNEILSFISTPTADWSNPFTSFDLIDGDPNYVQDKMKEYEPNFFGRIENSLNTSNSNFAFLGKALYGSADSFYAFWTGFDLLSPHNQPQHLNGDIITRGSSEAINTGIDGLLTTATLGRVRTPSLNVV